MRDIKFIRWGNIKPSKQFGYGEDSYHAPPAKKGLYAFPIEFVEEFLLGGFEFREDRHVWVKDSEGKLIPYVDDWKDNPELKKYCEFSKIFNEWDLNENYIWVRKTKLPPHEQFKTKRKNYYNWKDGKYLAKWKKPKTFRHYGNIWTHWQPKKDPILSVQGSWFLVEYVVFVKLLQKRFAQEKALKKSKGYSYSGDDCEVFIEKIISRKY